MKTSLLRLELRVKFQKIDSSCLIGHGLVMDWSLLIILMHRFDYGIFFLLFDIVGKNMCKNGETGKRQIWEVSVPQPEVKTGAWAI